jgi:predicted N-acetyltransferase YhbS
MRVVVREEVHADVAAIHRLNATAFKSNAEARLVDALRDASGLRWERPVPDEAFFVQELVPGGLDGVSGTVRYRPESTPSELA